MKKFILFVTIIAGLFFGCSTKKEKKPATVIPKTVGKIITDSVAPPVVIMITAANAPKVIKAAPPTIVRLSYPYGEGVPTITSYGIAEGLSSEGIRASAIDQQGNIWFATFSGLSKFDGTGFTNYNSENGMASDFLRGLFIDSKNNVWVGTSGGLSIFDGKYFAPLLIDKDLPLDVGMYSILEDKKGAIWFGTSYGLYKYADKTFTKYTTADGLADNSVSSVIKDKNGNLLISTRKGITIYDGKSFIPYLKIPLNKEDRLPYLLYCDRKGNIWFNNGFGELGKYDGSQIKIYSQKDRDSTNQLIGNTPITFLEDRKGNVWFGGFRELTKFDGNRFINYAPKDNQASIFQLQSLTEDEYGTIWAGTRSNGIYKISGSYLSKMEIPAGIVRGIAIDKFDNKWVLNLDGLGKYNSDHIAYYGKGRLAFGYGNTDLFIDHADNKWFKAVDLKTNSVNLVKFDGSEYTIFGKDQGLSFNSFTSIKEDDSNNIWFTSAKGMVKFNGSSFTSYGKSQGLNATSTATFFQDSKKNVWIGDDSSGVFKFDGYRFSHYTTRDGLPNNIITGITEDGLGNIWLATKGGAAKFDGNTFTSFGAIDGLNNIIDGVEFDPVNKSIWFATRIGLASLKMEKVKSKQPLFQHYNQRTGFNFSRTNNLIIDEQGIVWGLDRGVFRFDYKSIGNTKPIPLQIRNIKVNNKNISWNTLHKGTYPVDTKDSLTAINEMALKFGRSFLKEDFLTMESDFGKVSFDSVAGSDFIPVNLVLPIKNNNISFEFGSISTSFGKAIQYQYKLEGYDKNWSELNTKTEASFGNMTEGNYTFHLKALSPFGSWSETSYSFKVLPPWYRTWWAYTIYTLLFLAALRAFSLWRERRLRQEKEQLQNKVEERTVELKQSMEDLKSTQAQLIQSEKLASLGELTAGIAHEIQNPLNFVNNFSEVSVELMQELKSPLTLEGGIKPGEKIDMEVFDDLTQNLEKITLHGKRASSIVKGMLEHSRTSTGQKELTDINALADEYLRLSYHGLRAKDKDFNADFKTEFDPNLPKINIIPQDIGRVILNLITNAFYVVNEKSKQGIEGFEPTVSISTKHSPLPGRGAGGEVLISVKDNGNGIPEKILDKIFQPFFTTKPTGQGIGLGLSLSYDIVKAHGGELSVETKEGEGSIFIIQLPIV